jgi:hypothetical protein
MTPAQALRQYEDGRITITGLILAMLSQTNKRLVEESLGRLPPEALKELEIFVQNYRPKMKVFRGPRARAATVRFVKDWLVKRESFRQLVGSR